MPSCHPRPLTLRVHGPKAREWQHTQKWPPHQLSRRLDGQRRWNRRLWRRLARAPEAVVGRP
eukprot:scaffold56145_cov72-Phaeocystis_antarctica.AAC.2